MLDGRSSKILEKIQTNQPYSYEVAHALLPEEVLARVKRIRSLVDQIYRSIESEEEEEVSEQVRNALGQLFVELAYMSVFEEVASNTESPLRQRLIGGVQVRQPAELQLDIRQVSFSIGVQEIDIEKREGVRKLVEGLRERVKIYTKFFSQYEDADQTTLEVIEDYDIGRDSLLHICSFEGAEKRWIGEQIALIQERFKLDSPADIGMFDVGFGQGRTIAGSYDTIKSLFGEAVANAFLANASGADICKKNVEYTQRFLGGISGLGGELLESFAEADLLGKRIVRPNRRFHLVTELMRTLFHCNTEEKLRIGLENVESLLVPGTSERPGGRFLVDGVYIPSPSTFNKSRCDDLAHLYHQLSLAYPKTAPVPFIEGVDYARMRRMPIYDNTTGRGFYSREIVRAQDINHMIQRHGIDLRFVEESRVLPNVNGVNRETLVEIGRGTLLQNDLYDVVQLKVLDRLMGEKIDREYVLSLPPATRAEDNIHTRLMEDICYRSVANFPVTHMIFERPQKVA